MRFLSTRRKHPAAKPLVLLLALFLMGAAYSVVSPAQTSVADLANRTPQEWPDGELIDLGGKRVRRIDTQIGRAHV